MNRARLTRFITATLVLTMLLTAAPAPPPLAGVETADAAFLSPNAILGLFRIGGALGQRNRVYRESGATAEEINAYYDGLIARAQGVRKDYLTGAKTGERAPQFAPAYTRVEAALEAERRAAVQMIEAEKNQARRDFNRKLGKEIANILIASPGGQRIIGRIRETIKGAREAAIAVRVAANEGRPIEALGNALAKQVGDMEIAQEAARALGSTVGHGIDRALGGAIGKVERAIDNIQAEMGAAVDVLDDMDATVGRYDGQERAPVSLVEDDSLIGKLIPVDRANPAIDIAASAYAGASALAGALGPGTSRGAMRDRIRGALLDERLTGIRDLLAGRAAGQVSCTIADRGEYEAAAQALGETPQIPEDPNRAVYLVCYDMQTLAPVSAAMLGSAAEETTAESAPEPQATEPPAAAAAAAEVDPCSLLPVDPGMVINPSKDSCVATIDALVGCTGCNSTLDITRTESAEAARQFLRGGGVRCGNPNFVTTGASPLGDVGVTCTDISGEPYREGVAQSYYRIAFSSGPWLVSIHLTFPGQEELALSLGQEVIERIAALP